MSVVIPVGTIDEALATQVRAVLRQNTGRAFEVILACNVPGDRAAQQLDDLVSSIGDGRVRHVSAADRRGASHARNIGAANACGAILAFCDGDDVVHETWLDPLVRGLGSFDAVCGRLIDVGVDDRHRRMRPPAAPDNLPTFLDVPYLYSGSLAIRRPVFQQVGGFDERLVRCEDIALSWSLIVKGFRIGFVPESCADYTHRPGLRRLIKQHYLYGKGMSQVLLRYGKPDGTAWARQLGVALLKPNGQPGGSASLAGTLRRGSIATGRLAGIVAERRRLGEVDYGGDATQV